ncbi:hypothetical protein BVRB_7g166320 [Beta vulgaris subsp. vulgaris]|nr:hypothetical protein BVRB_7g166320 [Beta vulgaris subsp. vulgaris]
MKLKPNTTPLFFSPAETATSDHPYNRLKPPELHRPRPPKSTVTPPATTRDFPFSAPLLRRDPLPATKSPPEFHR